MRTPCSLLRSVRDRAWRVEALEADGRFACPRHDETAYVDEVLTGARRVAYLSPNQRRLYETVRYAASKGFSAADILELGLPERIATRDALALAQRGLDELARVQIK